MKLGKFGNSYVDNVSFYYILDIFVAELGPSPTPPPPEKKSPSYGLEYNLFFSFMSLDFKMSAGSKRKSQSVTLLSFFKRTKGEDSAEISVQVERESTDNVVDKEEKIISDADLPDSDDIGIILKKQVNLIFEKKLLI